MAVYIAAMQSPNRAAAPSSTKQDSFLTQNALNREAEMKNKNIGTILLCILTAVVLYGPWPFALRLSDPGIIRPGLALAFGIALTAGLIFSIIRLLRGRTPTVPFGDNKALDNLRRAFTAQENRQIIGSIAKKALSQLSSFSQKSASLNQSLTTRFGDSSITYSRFADTLNQAPDAIYNSLDLLLERMKAFDEKEYMSLSLRISSGDYKKDPIPAKVQEDRLLLLSDHLHDMERILESNEKLLLMMDQCNLELSSMKDSESEKENQRILEEIRQLAESTKYYSQHI